MGKRVIRVSYQEVLSANGSLQELLRQKLPLSDSIKLVRLVSVLKDPLSEFRVLQEKLIKDSGNSVDSSTGQVIFKDDNTRGEYLRQFSDLLREQVEVTFTPLPVSDLSGSLEISPQGLISLSAFLEGV